MNLEEVETYLMKQAQYKSMTDARSGAGGSLGNWVRLRCAELRLREASGSRNAEGVRT